MKIRAQGTCAILTGRRTNDGMGSYVANEVIRLLRLKLLPLREVL